MLEYTLLLVAWGGGVVAAFALARVVGSDAVGDHHDWLLGDRWLLLAGAGTAFAALFWWWLWHSGHLGHGWSAAVRVLMRGPAPTSDVESVAGIVDIADPPEHYDLKSAVLLLIDTSRYSTRSVERVTIGDGYYRHQLTSEFVLPSDTDAGSKLATEQERPLLSRLPLGLDDDVESLLKRLPFRDGKEEERTFLLPILRIGRGVLVDNLEVATPDGQRISTLNINEYYGLIDYVVSAYALALSGEQALTPDQEQGIAELIRQASFTGVYTGDGDGPGVDDESWLEWVRGITIPEKHRTTSAREAAWYAWKERLVEFCKAVRDAYVIFVPFRGRSGGRVVVDYSYTQPHRPSKRGFGLRDRTRYRLGLRPHQHRLTLTEHRWARSYHLEFAAPVEQYIHRCVVRGLHEKSGGTAGSIVNYASCGAHGFGYSHVYVRETNRDNYRERDELVVELDCREKPPGMLGNVAVIALAEAILIWVIGVRHNSYFGQRTDNLTADLPALLLAAPGLVVGWLGAQITGDRLRTTSIATMNGLILCGLLAIGSTGLALLKSSGNVFGGWLNVDHPSWTVAMVASAVLFIDMALRLWLKGRRFSKLLREGSEFETKFV